MAKRPARGKVGAEELFSAVCDGDVPAVKAALDAGAGVNVYDSTGRTPIMAAAFHGRVEVVKALLAAGANPRARCRERFDENGWTALHYASDANAGEPAAKQVEIIKLLVKAKADVNARSRDRRTPLLLAAFSGCPERTKALLKAGADVGARDENGNTALMLAWDPDEDAAPPSAPERGRRDPLAKVKQLERTLHVVQRSLRRDVQKLLIKAGADVEGVRDVALFRAAEAGDVGRVRRLLAQGADPNHRHVDGTALIQASSNGHVECVKALIEAGANVNQRGSAGHLTPLMHAASDGHLEVVRALIDARANLAIEVKGVGTALDYARQSLLNNHYEGRPYRAVVDLLVAVGTPAKSKALARIVAERLG